MSDITPDYPTIAALLVKHLTPDRDPYGKDAFSFPGGGSGVGYATNTPECYKHPAPVEVIRMDVTPEQRLADLERLVGWYKGRKFLTVSFDLEDATWLIEQARRNDGAL